MRQLLLTAALLFCMLAQAQINPKDGYIITNDLDTIYGTVDFRTNEINARQCSFRANGETEFKTYLPGEIEGYRFTGNGKFYVSRKFEDTDYLFAEYMVKGMISLYRYQDKFKNIYYIEKEDGKIIKYEAKGAGDKYQADSVLAAAQRVYSEVSRSEHARNDIKSGTMNEKDLINIVEDYHYDLCTSGEKCIVFQYDKEADKTKLHFTFNVAGGYCVWNSDMLRTAYGPMGLSYTPLDVDNGAFFGAGIGLDIEAGRKIKNQIVQVALNYTYQKAVGTDVYWLGGEREGWIQSLSLAAGPLYRFGNPNKPMFTTRFGWMPSYLWCRNECEVLNDGTVRYCSDSEMNICGFYAGVGYEIPMDKHALTFNIDCRSCMNFKVFYIAGTVGFRL